MTHSAIRRTGLALFLCLGAIGAAAQPPHSPALAPLRLEIGPDTDLRAAATAALRTRGLGLGFAPGDLDELIETDRSRSRGATHLYLRQHLGGIGIDDANATITIDSAGLMRMPRARFVRGLAAHNATRRPQLDAKDAILAAAAHLGIEADGRPRRLSGEPGAERKAVYTSAGISRDEIPVKLTYVPRGGASLALCWNVVVRTPDGRHWWSLFVDATDGLVVKQSDWIAHDSYRAFPLPLASPDEGPRTLLADPADTTASPLGWHDTNGVAGADFTDTRGNNVFAQEDTDADDSSGLRPDGGPTLDFDFPLDLATQPGNYLEASVANLFTLNNILHDVLYQYGFDEASGNFQQNNYGNPGSAGDPVQADTQDGADTNNARFGTPPDGFDPRMEMFPFVQFPSPRLLVHAPPAISGTILGARALFGGGTAGLPGILVQALDPPDGAGPSATDACSPLTNAGAVAGNIALIDRGSCDFTVKVANAQAAGAIAAVIANNAGDGLVNMAGVDSSLTIPAIFVGQSDGATLVSQLGAGVSLDLVSIADRDSSLDAGVVVHEYTHGVSNRLTGGPATVSCLDAAESAGMGEGWSDFLALVMTALPSDQPEDARGIGAYLLGQPPNGSGFRNAPYSTDTNESPFTYGDVSGLNQPHGVGEVWAVALWELYWNLVDAHGFDADLHAGTGGNNMAIQLVLDGMKTQPCDPTFVEGRDAILATDAAANGGANECLIWEAFAKRGVGESASDGGGPDTLAVSEAFDVPVACPEPGAGLMFGAGAFLLGALDRRRKRRSPHRA